MSTKPLVPRELAERDVQEALDWYLLEAGAQVALGFIDALEQAYAHIALHPATGSRAMPTNSGCPACAHGR